LRKSFLTSCVGNCHPNCGWNRNLDYHNRFGEANESQRGRNVFAVIKATEVSVEKE